MQALQEKAALHRRDDRGVFVFVDEWRRPIAPGYGSCVIDHESVELIQRLYGAGEYRISYFDFTGDPCAKTVVVAKPLVREQPAPPMAPSTFSPLPLGFMERIPLHELSAMLLSALGPRASEPLSQSLGRSIADGWMSTLKLASSPGEETVKPTHPWLRLLPVFYDRSDTDIYRAYVGASLVVDRDDIREHMLDGLSRVRTVCERFSTMNAAAVSQQGGNWYLWLDDERNPAVVLAEDNGDVCLGERYKQFVDAGLVAAPWRWARTVEQAIWMVEAYGLPRVMALDHDLGGAATSMQFLRWMSDNWSHVPEWYVHSANPVGSENMVSYLRSWARSIGETEEKKFAEEMDNEDDADDEDDVAAFNEELAHATDEATQAVEDEIAASDGARVMKV